LTDSFLDFLNEACTPFHAVQAARSRLLDAGFVEILEADSWVDQLQVGGKYFLTRNQSTLVAFGVGNEFKVDGSSGFTIIGAHTDSPCPRLKPVSTLKKGQFHMLNIQTYGGGLWHTWFDRDLTVAGRAIVRLSGGGFAHRLVHIRRPLLRISTLAIHLTSGDERGKFAPNLQTEFMPLLATEAGEKLWSEGKGQASDGRHPLLLLHLLAEEIGCAPDEIEDFELCVCDTQPSVKGGALDEFVFSGRLDNLCSAFQATQALIDSSPSLLSEKNVRMVALFDHEEIGSTSAVGAQGPVLMNTLLRVCNVFTEQSGKKSADSFERTLAQSFVVSCDMAHACHPNYEGKHDPGMKPQIGGGMVLKHNANQRYATNSVTAFIFRELGRRAGLKTQEFAVRNDSACGSTIGPITASLTGIRTVDVGSPQLSMHSIREIMGTQDLNAGYLHLKTVLENFSQINSELVVDGPSLSTPAPAL